MVLSVSPHRPQGTVRQLDQRRCCLRLRADDIDEIARARWARDQQQALVERDWVAGELHRLIETLRLSAASCEQQQAGDETCALLHDQFLIRLLSSKPVTVLSALGSFQSMNVMRPSGCCRLMKTDCDAGATPIEIGGFSSCVIGSTKKLESDTRCTSRKPRGSLRNRMNRYELSGTIAIGPSGAAVCCSFTS